jgi:hypothetical protein
MRMLTLFTTAKPFKGHNAVIQRNALKSWTLLHPDVEVIVFGSDEGAAEVCAELGLRHEVAVARTEFGAVRLDDMFRRAQEIAKHNVVCYANCDIIFTVELLRAVERVQAAHSQFLMAGRRWDTDITEPLDFSRKEWAEETRKKALAANAPRDEGWIDYFVFSRGLYGEGLLPLAIGRTVWDEWLVWRALASNRPVIDASPVVVAIHQNHDYGHHQKGWQGVWRGEDARRNSELLGRSQHLRSVADATEVLTSAGLRPNRKRHWLAVKRKAAVGGRFLLYKAWLPVWHAALGITRPLRQSLGLRGSSARPPEDRS